MLLYFVLAIVGAYALYVAYHYRADRKKVKAYFASVAAPEEVVIDANPDTPLPFGSDTNWIAVRAGDSREVANSLGLKALEPANWRTGLQKARQTYGPEVFVMRPVMHVFVSPPVDGWVFVIGNALPDQGDLESPDFCTPLLKLLGRKFDPVLYFASLGELGRAAWARVDGGAVTRAYGYVGDQGILAWKTGAKTEEERQLGFNFFADEPGKDEGKEPYDVENPRVPEADDVIRIAEAWSINPQLLNTIDLPVSVGIVGRVPESWWQVS